MEIKKWMVWVLAVFFWAPWISVAGSQADNPDNLHITELEEKAVQLDEAASGLQDDIQYLKKELEADEALAADYEKAIRSYKSFVDSEEYFYDLRPSMPDIVLSDGRTLETEKEAETYVNQARKDLPRLRQVIAEHQALLGEIQKNYESLVTERRVYTTTLTKRRSHMAITGYWEIQGRKGVVKIIQPSEKNHYDGKKVAYYGIAEGNGFRKFKRGEIIFFLFEPDIMDPDNYNGVEYEWGPAMAGARGSSGKCTDIRVQLEENSKKIHYRSREQYLIFKKLPWPASSPGVSGIE